MTNPPTASLAVVAGARPNFMKIAPLLRAVEKEGSIETTLIHTGQHYDRSLSEVFFEELGIRAPDKHLEVGGGTHAEQTARIIERIAPVLQAGSASDRPFDGLVVVGDVNSTMAASIAAAKLNIQVIHVEAGLRSRDRTMPEEINRILTDSITDVLLVSEPAGVENLLQEGHPRGHIHLVGNLMIDTLLQQVQLARQSTILDKLSLQPTKYGVVTLHRPSNVDDKQTLSRIVDVLLSVTEQMPIAFPVHPRTSSRLRDFGLMEALQSNARLQVLEPLGYLDFLCLTSQARVVITDSGGLQEETTALNVPCLTMRENTERPITVEQGTSTLVGSDSEELRAALQSVLAGRYKAGACPELWDGQAAERIVEVLKQHFA